MFGAAAWLPLAMRSAETTFFLGALGATLGVVGSVLTMFAMGSLGRSFGIIAAGED